MTRQEKEGFIMQSQKTLKEFDSITQCVLSNFFDLPELQNMEGENMLIFKKMLNRLNPINNEEKIIKNSVLDAIDFYYNQFYND